MENHKLKLEKNQASYAVIKTTNSNKKDLQPVFVNVVRAQTSRLTVFQYNVIMYKLYVVG